MHPTTSILRMVAAMGVASLVAMEPAFAGIEPVAVPAPLVGAGIPALIAFAGGYWAIRRRRR